MAISTLAAWYYGYCFDGKTTCFNTAAVLAALDDGEIIEYEMGSAHLVSGYGLTPDAILSAANTHSMPAVVQTFDIAHLEDNTVDPTALLLQFGLLAVKPSGAGAAPGNDPIRSVTVRPPNEYARRKLLDIVSRVTCRNISDRTNDVRRLRAALAAHDHEAFGAVLREVLHAAPYGMTKIKPGPGGAPALPREAPFHSCLYGLLRAALPPSVCTVDTESSSCAGSADLVLKLMDQRAGSDAAVWILELGIRPKDESKKPRVDPLQDPALVKLLDGKRDQAKRYYGAFAGLPGAVAAIVMDYQNGTIVTKWARWAPKATGQQDGHWDDSQQASATALTQPDSE